MITTSRPTTAAIIGGGPAGLMAAERLAASGHAVTLFDHMPSLGRKLLLAGRGGLNITHSEPLPTLLARYGPASDAVGTWLAGFPPAALRAWCEGLGEPTFIGSSGRVFPRSFKATPLLRAWLRRLADLGVQVRTRHRWTGWTGDALRFETPHGVLPLRVDATVLALGGASWPRLGSDAAWLPVLDSQGVLVTPLRPANCGFVCDWPPGFGTRVEGQPLKRIAARFGADLVRGEAMLTADGIEGGAVYALSATLRETIAREGAATLTLDLRPDLGLAALSQRLGGSGVSTANALRRAGLSWAAAALVRLAPPSASLAERVKAVPLRLIRPKPIERAISTAGGVSFASLDGLMLRSRPGVFVAGEMLDWEAPTGGYLLQACLSSGVAAADQVAAWLSGR